MYSLVVNSLYIMRRFSYGWLMFLSVSMIATIWVDNTEAIVYLLLLASAMVCMTLLGLYGVMISEPWGRYTRAMPYTSRQIVSALYTIRIGLQLLGLGIGVVFLFLMRAPITSAHVNFMLLTNGFFLSVIACAYIGMGVEHTPPYKRLQHSPYRLLCYLPGLFGLSSLLTPFIMLYLFAGPARIHALAHSPSWAAAEALLDYSRRWWGYALVCAGLFVASYFISVWCYRHRDA